MQIKAVNKEVFWKASTQVIWRAHKSHVQILWPANEHNRIIFYNNWENFLLFWIVLASFYVVDIVSILNDI